MTQPADDRTNDQKIIDAILSLKIWTAQKCDKLAGGKLHAEYVKRAKQCLTVVLGRKPTAEEVDRLTTW